MRLQNSKLLHGVVSLSIVIVCVLSFSNGLNGKFILDDQVILLRNQHIRSLSNIPSLFRMNWWGMTDVQAAGALYRPLAAASFAVDVHLMGGYQSSRSALNPDTGGYDVRYFHAATIVYHAIASLLVYALLLFFLEGSGRVRWAWMGALIFAVHPVHVEAVTGLVGRADVLGGMFFFAGALTFLRGSRDKDRPAWAAVSAVLWLAGLLSKEMAVTLPIMLVLIEWLQGKRRSLGRWVLMYAPFVAAALVYGYMRSAALGHDVLVASFQALPPATVSYGARLMTMTHALASYWRLIVLPIQLTADYNGFPITREWWDSPPFVGSVILHVALVYIAARTLLVARKKGNSWPGLLGLGIVGFYIMLAPVSNVLVNTGIIIAERILYVVSFWPVLAFAALLQRVEKTSWSAKNPRVLLVAGSLLVGAGVLGCRLNNANWADERKCFEAAVKNPYCGHIGLAGLARTYIIAGDYATALPLAERSVRQSPNVINFDYQARCLFALGRYREAIVPLDILVRNGTGGAPMIERLVQSYIHEGRKKDARLLLDQHPDLSRPGGPLNSYVQQVQGP